MMGVYTYEAHKPEKHFENRKKSEWIKGGNKIFIPKSILIERGECEWILFRLSVHVRHVFIHRQATEGFT